MFNAELQLKSSTLAAIGPNAYFEVLRLLVLLVVKEINCDSLNILQVKLPDIPASSKRSRQGLGAGTQANCQCTGAEHTTLPGPRRTQGTVRQYRLCIGYTQRVQCIVVHMM